MALSPTWYDVLGVSRDASPEEIKAAWREATDRFEPGSGGQFRTFSEAADVLLDPARRRAYDATLAPETEEPEEPGPAPTSTAPAPEGPSASEAVPSTRAVGPSRAERRAARPAATGATTAGLADGAGAGRSAPLTRGWLLAVGAVSVVLALVVAVAVVLGIKVQQRAGVLAARTEAPPAAEAAVKVLFSYDYRDLEQERARMGAYMTPAFAKDYLKAFDALIKQKDGSPGMAVQTKAVVTATVLGSGVIDADDGTARVLLYVNLLRKQGSGQPTLFQNRVAATMQKSGDRWLVSKVTTY